jgi:hypothetical protein
MTEPHPIIICGSRTWDDPAPIRRLLTAIKANVENPVVIHGAAKGADRLAATIATELEIESIAFPADWDTHGKAAGMIRNKEMLNYPGVTHVFAFRVGKASRGTDNMLRIARAAGKYTGVYSTQHNL